MVRFIVEPLIIWSVLVTVSCKSGLTSDFPAGAHAHDQYPQQVLLRSRRASISADAATAAANTKESLEGEWTNDSGQASSIHHYHDDESSGKKIIWTNADGRPDKDLPSPPPVSLVNFDYSSTSDEETSSNEETDELVKFRKMFDDDVALLKRVRGDIGQISREINDDVDSNDELPLRGDTVTRNKRSSSSRDGFWGFDENEGGEPSAELDLQQMRNNLESRDTHQRRQMDRENKLLDYIARNRPISVVARNTPARKSLMDTNPGKLLTNSPNTETMRLNNLPVSARIIIVRDSSLQKEEKPSNPTFSTRQNFDSDIDFPALSPNNRGLAVAHFPAAPTPRPPSQPPNACVWAVLQCCPSTSVDHGRLTRCFEYMDCPGINWDPNPCRPAIADAARAEVFKYYASSRRSR